MFESAREWAALREWCWSPGAFLGGAGPVHGQSLLERCSASAPSFLAATTGEGGQTCYNAKGCCGSPPPEASLTTSPPAYYAMVADDPNTHETRNV